VHELHVSGFVAKDDELHLLLIPHGFDPSGDADGTVFTSGEVLDEYAGSHHASLEEPIAR
jgi:hypothetical protein